MKSAAATLVLSLFSAAFCTEQICHFDSPEEIGRFLNRKNPEMLFETSRKAAGKGALKASGFSRYFNPKENISRLSLRVYDDTFDIRKDAANTLNIQFVRKENGKERNSNWQLIKSPNGWQLRYTEANGIRRFFRLTEAPEHGGWLRFDVAKTGAGQTPYVIALNGHEIVRTYEPYDFIRSIGASGFPVYDEFSASSSGTCQPNPVAAIFPENRYGAVLLNPGEKVKVPLSSGRPLKNGEKITLNLLNGRAEIVHSVTGTPAVRNGSMTMILPSPPRSGFYTLETRSGLPGEAPDVTRRKMEFQFLNSEFENAAFAPLRLSEALWDFLPVGTFNPRIHPLTLQPPSGNIFKTPAAVPADWKNAKKMRGEWMNLRDHFKIGQSWYAGWYRQKAMVPADWKGRKIQLLIDDPQSIATVFINGKKSGELEWPGGTLDVTHNIVLGRENEIAVYVQANPIYGYYRTVKEILGKNFRPPLPGWRGLAGDVVLFPVSNSASLAHVSIRPSFRKKRLTAVFDCTNLKPGERYTLRSAVSTAGKTVRKLDDRIFTANGENEKITLSMNWENPLLWDFGKPNLYDLNAVLLDQNGKRLDTLWPERFGFREVWAEGSLLYMNGRKITLFDDNGRMPAVPDFVVRHEKYGFSSFYHYLGAPDARRLDEAGLSCGRDSAFLPISRMAVLLANSGKIDDPRFWQTAERIIRHQVRRRENHPGVFFHYGPMGGGMARTGGFYNPMFQNGTWHTTGNGKQLVVDLVGAARRIYSLIKQNDPDRLVAAQDSGSLNDTMQCTEYRGFQPVQEMIEIGEFWRRIAGKPFFISEQAAPFLVNWTDSCAQGKGWNGVPSIHEWAAITHGNDAFVRSASDKKALSILEQEVRQKRARSPRKDRKSLLRLRMTSSPQGPWLNALGEKITADRIRAQVFFWRADHLGLLNFQYIPYLSFRKALTKEVQMPVTGFLAGTPRRKTAKDHIYRPGETMDRIAILLNNTNRAEELTCVWKLELGGKTVRNEKITKKIAPGENASVPFIHSIPQGKNDLAGTLTAEFFRNGEFLRKDVCTIDVLAEEKPLKTGKIALIDPELKTADLFDRLGIPYRFMMFDEDLSGFDLIVFGRRAFRYETNLLPAGLNLGNLLRSGKKILVMEQDESILRSRFGFRTEYSSSRSVFGRVRGTSNLFEGLPDRLLNNWRGIATLTDGYAPAREKNTPLNTDHTGNGGTWNYLWNDGEAHPRPMKWGNTHNVATVTIIKPDTGNFRTLADCEHFLNYAAALELEYARGRIVFNQLDVSGRTENDPAAERFFRNLIRYSADYTPKPFRQIVCSGDAESFLRGLNIPFEKATVLNPEKHLFVLGGQAPAGLREFVQNGGIVFSLPKTQSGLNNLNLPFPVKTKSGLVNQSIIGEPGNPLLHGFGNADFFWKGNLQIDRIESAGNDAFIINNGILAEVPYGKGRYVFCQIAPAMFGDTELDHWLKPSAQRTERVISMLLTNLNGVQKMPSFLNQPGNPAKFEYSLNLDGKWQAAKGDARLDSAPAENSGAWRTITLPGNIQSAVPGWTGRKGRFWYKKTFHLDPKSSSFRLKTGCISGADRLWINGKLVGVTDSETDVNAVAVVPRDYAVLKDVLKKGENEILVCVDYETDAALGLNGSTGDIQFPFELHAYSSVLGNEIPAPLELSGKKIWRAQKVSGIAEKWNPGKSIAIEIPCNIQDQTPEWGGQSGYFRIMRTLTLSSALPDNVSPVLQIGAVDDEDIVFINGVEIGRTTKQTNPHNCWSAKRQYTIPRNLLKEGENRLEILLHDFNGSGGVSGPVKLFFETPEQARKRMLLNGFYLHEVSRPDDPYWHHGF